jgi:hypothetical protein
VGPPDDEEAPKKKFRLVGSSKEYSSLDEFFDIAPVAVEESMEQALAGGVPGDIDDICEPDPNDPRRSFFNN